MDKLKPLEEWVARARKAGLTEGEIKGRLTQSGYREADITGLVCQSKGESSPNAGGPSKKKGLPTFLTIVFIVGVVLIGFILYEKLVLHPASFVENTTFYAESLTAGRNLNQLIEAETYSRNQLSEEIDASYKKVCPTWVGEYDCFSEYIAQYVQLKQKIGLTPEEILQDDSLRLELIRRKSMARGFMDDYLDGRNQTILKYNFSFMRFTLPTVSSLNLMTDEERVHWMNDLLKVDPPDRFIRVRRDQTIRFLSYDLHVYDISSIGNIPLLESEKLIATLCEGEEVDYLDMGLGYIREHIYGRYYCNEPLSAQEIEKLNETFAVMGLPEEDQTIIDDINRLIERGYTVSPVWPTYGNDEGLSLNQ